MDKKLELRKKSGLEIYWGTLVFRGILEEVGPARN